MGKSIKPQRTRKHKKLKAIDPFYFGPRTSDKKAALANQPPKKNDDDVIPNRVREIMELKAKAKNANKAKQRKSKKRKKNDFLEDPTKVKMEKGMTRPVKPVPLFRQGKGESDGHFMMRIDRETRALINRSKIEDKYDVDIYETESGGYRIEKKKTDEMLEAESRKKKRKIMKKQEKIKEKKNAKLQEKIENFDHLRDQVIFGEVAMAPPTLTAKPRKAKGTKTNKPGMKSLLLKDLLQSTEEKPKSATERSVGQSIKRKYMSVAEQRIMDIEREKAITMYRLLKKKKSVQQKMSCS